MLGDVRADAQLFIGTGRSDDGMDQASSGVADECTCSSGAVSSSICRSLGIDKIDGLSRVSVVVQAVYSAKVVIFEELGAAVVEEGVADEVETQVVFLVNHVSFSSFFMLQPNQLGAGQSDHGPLTSPELRTACIFMSFVGVGFPHAMVKNLFHVSFWQISEAIPEWSLNSLVNSIRDNFIHCLTH
ncbi:hypothetical protein Tco_0091067 [Tanacetum coccineum]